MNERSWDCSGSQLILGCWKFFICIKGFNDVLNSKLTLCQKKHKSWMVDPLMFHLSWIHEGFFILFYDSTWVTPNEGRWIHFKSNIILFWFILFYRFIRLVNFVNFIQRIKLITNSDLFDGEDTDLFGWLIYIFWKADLFGV